MKKKTLNKTIFKSFIESKGRFLSIMLLMMLGSMTLVALKVTGPDIDKSANKYYEDYNLSDVNVISDYGITTSDTKEIDQIKNIADVEYGYFSDATIDDTPTSFRIFSNTKNISNFELVSGKFPQKIGDIALTDQYKSKYKIGDKIKFKEKDEDSKILKKEEFTVTGFVNSTEIVSKTALGNSSAGSGNLEGYAVVTPDNFDTDVYTIVRARFHDVRGLNYTDSEYTRKVDKHQKQLDEILKDNGKQRLEEIKSKANDKIAKSKKKIEDAKKEITDAEKKLSDGQKKIDDEKAKLVSAQKQIADKESVIKNSKYQIESAESRLQATKKQLDDAKIQLDDGQKKLNAKKNEVEANRKKLSQLKSTLDATKKDLDSANAQINQGKLQIQQATQNLEQKKAELIKQGINPENVPEIAQGQASIAQQKQKLKQSEAKYTEGLAKYNQGLQQYKLGMKKITKFDNSQRQLNEKKKLYQNGLAKYNRGIAQLNASKTKYQNGIAQLNSSKKQIQEGLNKISSSQKELDDKKKEFENEKKKADDKIQDAESKIHDAQIEIDGLSLPKYSTYTRRTMPGGDGIKMVETISSGITKVSNLFPVVLYLVAALVTITTMGYNDTDVIKKFVLYGLISGGLGTILGTLIGTYVLPYILCTSLLANMTIPPVKYYFSFKILGLSVVFAIICSVLPAVYISVKELRETAAQLLLPKPPTKGSKIFMERITPLWSRMTFTQKVTARNIFRYKQRMLMTIFGVAGSVALLFAGLGISSSIKGIQTKQYGQIIQYDAVVAKKDFVTEKEQAKIDQLLKSDDIQGYIPIHFENITKNIPGIEDEQTITMLVTHADTFSPYINLEHKNSEDALKITNDGIVISQKLADLMKVKIGDTITLKVANQDRKFKIAQITKMYAGHFIFMSDDYFAKITNDKPTNNSYFIALKDKSKTNVEKITAKFMASNGIKAVSQNTNVIIQVETMTNSLTKVMTVLTIMSLLLAIVILYNLTNINVAERIRELSTIKVLGFFNNEVTMYIYRETICLSIIGIIAGIFGGKILHKVILEKVAPAEIFFNPNIEVWVYILPVILVIVILYALGVIVNHKLKKVDMLEALKSVD